MNYKNELKVVSKYTKSGILLMTFIFIAIIVLNGVLTVIFDGYNNLNGQTIQNVLIYGFVIVFVTGIILTTRGFQIMGTLGYSRNKLSKAIIVCLIKYTFITTIIINLSNAIVNTIFTKGNVLGLFLGLNLNHKFSLDIFKNFVVIFIIVLLFASIGSIIGATFLSKGVFYGLSVIALIIGITLFFLTEIVNFVYWGLYVWTLVILFIITILLFMLTFNLLKYVEFKK